MARMRFGSPEERARHRGTAAQRNLKADSAKIRSEHTLNKKVVRFVEDSSRAHVEDNTLLVRNAHISDVDFSVKMSGCSCSGVPCTCVDSVSSTAGSSSISRPNFHSKPSSAASVSSPISVALRGSHGRRLRTPRHRLLPGLSAAASSASVSSAFSNGSYNSAAYQFSPAYDPDTPPETTAQALTRPGFSPSAHVCARRTNYRICARYTQRVDGRELLLVEQDHARYMLKAIPQARTVVVGRRQHVLAESGCGAGVGDDHDDGRGEDDGDGDGALNLAPAEIMTTPTFLSSVELGSLPVELRAALRLLSCECKQMQCDTCRLLGACGCDNRSTECCDIHALERTEWASLPQHSGRPFAEAFVSGQASVAQLCRWGRDTCASALGQVPRVLMFFRFVPGKDLHAVLQERSLEPLPEQVVRLQFRQLLRGLAFAKARGVAHADIKLDNCIVDETLQQLTLIDWEMARIVPPSVDRDSRWCSDTSGTVEFLAPEIAFDRPFDPFAADVWSAGVTLFSVLCAELPFSKAPADCANIEDFAKQLNYLDWAGIQAGTTVRRRASMALRLLSSDARMFLRRLLCIKPEDRPTVEQLLLDPWISDPLEHIPDSANNQVRKSGFLRTQSTGDLVGMSNRLSRYKVLPSGSVGLLPADSSDAEDTQYNAGSDDEQGRGRVDEDDRVFASDRFPSSATAGISSDEEDELAAASLFRAGSVGRGLDRLAAGFGLHHGEEEEGDPQTGDPQAPSVPALCPEQATPQDAAARLLIEFHRGPSPDNF